MYRETMYFDKNTGDLICWEDNGTPPRRGYIPAKQVGIIAKNLKEGKSYIEASPLYPITREQAAFILAERGR